MHFTFAPSINRGQPVKMAPLAIDVDPHASTAHGRLATMALGALGVVYGDIGTSPLYTMKTALEWAGGEATPAVALGMLSLIVWTLLITTSIKYVAVVMRADNEGEGGILALMSLLGIKHGNRVGIIALGILGAALLYGDGAITPAISVLSALEGLKLPVPMIAPYIVPLSVVVLAGVFGLQPQGSARIGKLFGPIMTIWFITIGVLGLGGVLHHPSAFMALDPRYGLTYLFTHGFSGFLVLGAVFLCATGAEALYADMGHFGPRPIRLAWYGLVLPMLVLNYAGQTAMVIDGAVAAQANPFFVLCPAPLQIPLVLLATVATIIASQSIISGAFSMTRQAIQLGLCPRMHITQTSAEGYGQIYVGFVNWLLMALTLVDGNVPLIGQFGGCFRHRSVDDHVADLDSDVPGDARHLALAPRREPYRGGAVRYRRSVLCHRQHDENLRGWLGPACRGRHHFLSHVDLAGMPQGDAREAGARHLAALFLHHEN